ncbi:hypothetical protein [Acidiphilium sp.]|uniref:hypothetical protein n=1 Tax=Acidiphilium sp. TaxID=527 RepID=UPI0038D02FDC
MPLRLFTTNRWVTGESFEPGAITRPAISARARLRSRDALRPSRRGSSSLRIIPSAAAT